MTLAEKITMLRKQNNWSQEDLAERLDISRQSVSKWESSASVPDLDKIIRLSELFGVSTDYLLKDTMEKTVISNTISHTNNDYNNDYKEYATTEPLRNVSLKEAENFMGISRLAAKPMAVAVSLCILSPICLILLFGFAEYNMKIFGAVVTEQMASGLGIAILLILVAVAVAIFIMYGMQLSKYEYMEREIFTLEQSVQEIVEKKKEMFAPQLRICVAAGVVLCILGVVPLMLSIAFSGDGMIILWCVALLLLFVAVAVSFFVWSGMIHGSYCKLLQTEDYTPEKKKINLHFSSIYWCCITAVYLFISFYFNNWHKSWIIWPVAGVAYAAVFGILQARMEQKNK